MGKVFQILFCSSDCGDSSKFAEHVFRGVDLNRDGSINLTEFLCVINITSKGTVDEKLEWASNMYDLDKNGFITRREMVEIISAVYKMMGSEIVMPEDERTPEKRMQKIFRKMDENKDGKLSLKEFVEGARNEPTVCKLLALSNSSSGRFSDGLKRMNFVMI